MKLKELTVITALAFGMFACSSGEQAEEASADDTTTEEVAEEVSYTVDVAASIVNWRGDMVGMFFHTGTLNLSEGSISAAGGTITGGTFTIDMTSMAATDDNYSEDKPAEMLIGHLSSPDFFDIENNPTATFTITGADGNSVMGDLTIKGITNAETITDVTWEEGEDGSVTATGKLTFDRQKYGAAYAVDMKDMVISDDIQLEISLTATAN